MSSSLTPIGPRRHDVVLVVERQVVEDVLARVVHATQAVAHDDRGLVGEGRVVDLAIGDGRGDQHAVAVLVLQALPVERRAAGRGAQQEAAAACVAEGPELVADALEAEHRVEDVERDHRLGVRGVARAGGLEGGRRAGLGDALLEHLAVLRLAIAEHEVRVDRLVELPMRRVDAGLLEERLHAERACLVGHDRHHPLAERLVAHQVAQQLGEGHGGRGFLRPGAGHELVVDGVARQLDGLLQDDSPRDGSAERGAALVQVADLRRVWARVVVGRVLDLRVGDRRARGGRGRPSAPPRRASWPGA